MLRLQATAHGPHELVGPAISASTVECPQDHAHAYESQYAGTAGYAAASRCASGGGRPRLRILMQHRNVDNGGRASQQWACFLTLLALHTVRRLSGQFLAAFSGSDQ